MQLCFISTAAQSKYLYKYIVIHFSYISSLTLERGRKSLRAILWTFGFGLYHVANKLLQKVNHRIKGWNFFVFGTKPKSILSEATLISRVVEYMIVMEFLVN